MSPDELEKLIVARRSNLQIDPDRAVDDTLIDRIITVVQWAPNHRRTWPARLAVVSGGSRRRLGEVIAGAMTARGDDEFKIEKTKTKYLRSPFVVVVAAATGASDSESAENRYSVAAGTQNMLLMAESLGLAALWGSPAKGANDAITDFCGFENSDHVMGIVYVGWPLRGAQPVPRPGINVTRLT